MVPMQYHQFARQIHQERTQAAQSPRPEWPAFRVQLGSRVGTRLRLRFAGVLHALAASFDLSTPTRTAVGTHHSASID